MNLFPCRYVNNLDGFVLILMHPPSLIRLLAITNNAWQRVFHAIFFFLMQAFERAIPHWFDAKNVHSENHQTFNLKFSPPVFTVWSWIIADFTWASLIDPDGRCWSNALVIAETQESRYNILRTVLTRLTVTQVLTKPVCNRTEICRNYWVTLWIRMACLTFWTLLLLKLFRKFDSSRLKWAERMMMLGTV